MMNRIFTQLNIDKKLTSKNPLTVKFYTLFFLIAALIPGISVNAQDQKCSYDYPIQWDWIQEIIADSDGCSVGEIQYIFYNDYIQILPGESGLISCPSGGGNRVYDCLGNFICEYGGDTPFTTWCDQELIDFAMNGNESIWRYGADNPYQHNVIQVKGCPGERIEYYVGVETPDGASCEPAGQHIDLVPMTYQPIVTNVNQESACSISFTFQGEGNFIYSIQDPEDGSANLDCVFQLSYKESCNPASSCNVNNPQQIGWIQDLINSNDDCGVGAILQFENAGEVFFRVDPGKAQNGTPCPSENPYRLYNCAGELQCEFNISAFEEPVCDAALFAAARNSTIVWINQFSLPPEICPAGDPLQWQWIRNLIENNGGCQVETIQIAEADPLGMGRYTYILIYPGYPSGLYCWSDAPNYIYTCNGDFVCVGGFNALTIPDRCSNQMLLPTKSATTIWTYGDELPTLTCPAGDPLQWDFVQDIINQSNGRDGCGVGSIQQFQYNGSTFIKTTPGVFNEFGYFCPSDIPVYLYNCEGSIVCKTRALAVTPINEHCDADINAAAYNGTTIWTYGDSEPIEISPEVFQDYAWLSTYVNPNNCSGESITVYDAGSYNFVLIQDGNEGKLYFENGTFYCNETPTYSCVAAYGLNNVAQSWTCGNNAQVSGCTDATALNYNSNATVDDGSCQYETTNDPVFTTYPWLSTYVNQSDCAGANVTVYDAGSYNFILIQNGNEGKLYYQNGTFYCNETPTYSCVDAYGLNNIAQSWTCGFIPPNPELGCTDANAINYNPSATFDDGSCEYESTGTCNSNTGTFFYQDCGGINYYFIRLTDGRVFDPYFAEGIGINPLEGQQIRFDYVIKTDVTTPCTISESPITITCFEEISNSNNNLVFENYPWLNTLVNSNNCSNESITVYDAGSYNFIYIQSSTGNNLYYQDGTFYCQDAPDYSCVAAYNLSNVAANWACDPNPNTRDCNVDNPITDLDWLANLLYNQLNPPSSVRVSTYLYNDEVIYKVDFSDMDGNISYNYCDGENICFFNPFNQMNTCTDFSATFIEEIYSAPNNTETLQFDKYPWLSQPFLGLFSCIWEPQVLEFDFGNYAFVYFKTSQEGKLYLDDGTFYCEDTDGQTCLNNYNLSNPTTTWSCGGGASKTTKSEYLSDSKLQSTFKLYPNPANNKVFIDLPDDAVYQISFTDISGKVMKQMVTDLYQTNIKINVNDLPKGMYMVALKNESSQLLQKLIIE